MSQITNRRISTNKVSANIPVTELPNQLPVDNTNVTSGGGSGGINEQESRYVHDQSVASANWLIVHNLNARPSIVVVDTGGSRVFGEEITIDLNTTRILFSAPFSGIAECNI